MDNLFINVDRNTYRWSVDYEKHKYNSGIFKPRVNIDDYLLIHSSIAITNKCNLNCIYCYKEVNKKTEIHEIPKEEIFNYINLLTNMDNYKLKTIQLIGGEPLIHSEIIEIIDFLLSKGIQVRISTNGMSDIIKKPEFKHILNDTKVEFRVSLDSHIESIHDSFRGKGTFKKLIGNIEYLCQHKCRLSVKSVITKSNIKDLKPMLYFLKERNISNFAYSALYNLGSAEDKFYSENYISNSDILLEILNILEEDPSLAKLLRPNILRHVLDSLFIKNPYILSKMYLYVNYDGNIYPQDQLIYDKFCLGNIYKLNNDIFGDIVSRFKDIKLRYEINRKECLECDFYPFCVKGNYGELYKKDEKLLECFPNCDDLKKFISILMKNGSNSRNILLKMHNIS